MANTINRPRGTQDLYFENAKLYEGLFQKFASISELNGFSLIKTPMFESIETFVRSVGSTSDIVKKEFYNFVDKGGREIALRPEGTAGVARCVVEDKLLYTKPNPLMFYYFGPMFRYERPQSKRLREFNQFGCEIMNSNSFLDDFNVIKFSYDCLQSINIKDITFSINNLGGFESRAKWIETLKEYFVPFKDQLSELSQERLLKNPTRILDDKVDGEKEFVKKAPKISAFLSQEEIEEFNQLQNLLKSFNINYVINENLVRGLDYYTNTIFEILDKDGVALGGGGRYSKLVGEFGGEDVQCTGMAFGIDRIIGYLTENNINSGIDSNINIDILFVCLVNSMDAQVKILSYMDECRKQNLSCTCNFKITKLDKSFNYAEKLNAQYVFIIGNNELETNTITCKNINTKEQVNDNLSNLLKNIKK